MHYILVFVSIRKRKDRDNQWIVDLKHTYRPITPTSKPITRRIVRKIPPEYAKTKTSRLQFQNALIDELFNTSKEASFQLVANAYLIWRKAKVKRGELKFGTYKEDKAIIAKTLVNYFGNDFRVDLIDYHKIENFKRYNAKRRSRRGKVLKDEDGNDLMKSNLTQNQNLSVLSSILKYALKRKFIKHMPTIDRIKRERDNSRQAKTKAWSAKQVKEVLAIIPKQTHQGFPLRDFSKALFHSGLRINEALALHWDDLDYENQATIILHVRRTFVEGLKELTNTPKAGISKIPVSPELHAIFLNQPKRSEYIFTKANGDFQPANTLQGIYRNLPSPHDRITAHRFRHSLGRILVQTGAHLKEISDLLRHTSTDATQQYISTDMAGISKASNKASQLISSVLDG